MQYNEPSDTSERIRVMWLSHVGSMTGGADLCFVEGVTGLLGLGTSVQVVLPTPGNLMHRLEQVGASVNVIPYRPWVSNGIWRSPFARARRLIRNLLACYDLVTLIRRTRPQVVVTNTVTIPAGAVAAKAAGVPHLWFIHELYGSAGHDLFFDLGEKFSLTLINQLSHRVLVGSASVFHQYQPALSPGKLRQIPYAVEIPALPDGALGPENVLRLVLVGRKCLGKRQEDAIRALALLITQGLQVHLTLVGSEEPEYGNWLRRLASELKITNHITFVDFTANPFPYVAGADVALTCSKGEAFGRIVIEALKLGKPVVGAASAGTMELIRDGVYGFLYQLENPEDLASKIEILYHDRDLVTRLGQQGLEWATTTYSLENYARALLEVCREVQTQSTTRSTMLGRISGAGLSERETRFN